MNHDEMLACMVSRKLFHSAIDCNCNALTIPKLYAKIHDCTLLFQGLYTKKYFRVGNPELCINIVL
jgi:hypothetical protein